MQKQYKAHKKIALYSLKMKYSTYASVLADWHEM